MTFRYWKASMGQFLKKTLSILMEVPPPEEVNLK
jgi:hypothetical protein